MKVTGYRHLVVACKVKYSLFFHSIFLFLVLQSFTIAAQTDYKYQQKVMGNISERINNPQTQFIVDVPMFTLQYESSTGQYKSTQYTLDSILISEGRKGNFIVDHKKGNRPWGTEIFPKPTEVQDSMESKDDHVYNVDSTGLLLQRIDFFLEIKDQSYAMNYIIDGESFTVNYFVSYSCYDPFCGSRHGHIRLTWCQAYNPELGILYTNVMGRGIRLPDKKVPVALMREVLKEVNCEETYHTAYLQYVGEIK